MTGSKRDTMTPPVIAITLVMYEVYLFFRKHIFLSGSAMYFRQ